MKILKHHKNVKEDRNCAGYCQKGGYKSLRTKPTNKKGGSKNGRVSTEGYRVKKKFSEPPKVSAVTTSRRWF